VSAKLTLIIIVIVLVVIFAVWYLSSMFIGQFQQNSGSQQGVNNASDTTIKISNDLNQIPDDSSVNGEMNTLNQDLQSF